MRRQVVDDCGDVKSDAKAASNSRVEDEQYEVFVIPKANTAVVLERL